MNEGKNAPEESRKFNESNIQEPVRTSPNLSHTVGTATAPQIPIFPSSSKPPRTSKARNIRHKTISRVSQSKLGASSKRFEWKRFKPALVLENSGSVARDHLATERTFLAYVRTSLALASTGVALVQLFTIADLTSKATGSSTPDASRRIQRFARPLGVTFILLGLVVLVIGELI